MKENEFQGWILDLAETHGWRTWHVATPMRPIGKGKFVPEPRGRGLCDLIMFHEDPPRLIFAEVKNETGKLSVEQQEFLRLARGVSQFANGQDDHRAIGVYVWTPAVRPLIEATLKGKVMVQ